MTDPFETLIGQPWMRDAACARLGFEADQTFFPEGRGANLHEARRVCQGCPVIDQCREYVMSFEKQSHRFGMWAGMSPQQRERLAITGEA